MESQQAIRLLLFFFAGTMLLLASDAAYRLVSLWTGESVTVALTVILTLVLGDLAIVCGVCVWRSERIGGPPRW